MKNALAHLAAKLRGMRGLHKHRNIVSTINETRDALYSSARDMNAEVEANSVKLSAIVTRNDDLRQARRHATGIADQLHALFNNPAR